MNRRTLLWLSAIAALALVVAYQTLGSSAGRHADEFAARAGVPTVQPGADVLAGIAVLPKRIHRYDYRRSAFGHPWDDRNDAPGGHNGCDTRDDILDRDLVDKTYVSIKRCPNAVATGTLRDPYTNTTVALPTRRQCWPIGPDRPHRSALVCLGHGRLSVAELRANALRQRSGQPAGRAGAGKSGQGRFATGPMDATQQGLRLSVRDAIHRRAARLFTASGSAIVRRTASGRGHLPDGLVHAPTVNLTT